MAQGAPSYGKRDVYQFLEYHACYSVPSHLLILRPACAVFEDHWGRSLEVAFD